MLMFFSLFFFSIANCGTVSNFMINKAKMYTTGDRRSFVCRIRTGSDLHNKPNERVILNATDNFKGIHNKFMDFEWNYSKKNIFCQLKLTYLFRKTKTKTTDYRVVHFVGYLRTDLPSNLKFNDKSIKKECDENDATNNNANNNNNNANDSISSFDWSNSGPNSNSGSSLNKSVTSPAITLKTMTDSQSKLVKSLSSSTFPMNHSTSLIGSNLLEDPLNNNCASNSNISSSSMTSNSACKTLSASSSSSPQNNGSLQHYLITCGKIKQSDEELVQYKFISRHDADGKFIYLEPKLVYYLFNMRCRITIKRKGKTMAFF